MEKNKIFSKVYILNLVVNALAFLSFNMSISGFPILISKINSSYIVLGLVTSCSAITSLLIRPFVGLIAERFSSFRIILLGIFFMFISPLLCIISDNGVLFSSIGPKIPIKISFYEHVLGTVETSISEYGINNALLKVTLTIDLEQKLILPYKEQKVFNQYKLVIRLFLTTHVKYLNIIICF